jgi:hypothetical protein
MRIRNGLGARAVVAPLAVMTAGWAAACSSSTEPVDAPYGTLQLAGRGEGYGAGCDENLPSDSLEDFSKKCDVAIGETVPDFNCDDGTKVPTTHFSGGNCDRPNVLNAECDPDSRFQVLKQTNDVAIVAHCRHQAYNNAPGEYGDIAVIQYNKKNGATCFYQALQPHLAAKVTSPSQGTGAYPWETPAGTAGIRCVRCHDNGPFIRSPYLAQLNAEPVNRLPGTNSGSGPWDQRYSWNSTDPYKFIGNDFQSWKAYRVSNTGPGGNCSGCHRLGISSIAGSFSTTSGTAVRFGPLATAASQTAKNPHSSDSPIWMLPGQETYDATTESWAQDMSTCAKSIATHANDPSAPAPANGCNAVKYAQGDTCRNGAIEGEVGGATSSEPGDRRVDINVPVGEACAEGDCPIGFCGWRTLHGPFWQTSKSDVPIGDATYRGSFLRIYVDKGMYQTRAFVDSTGEPGPAQPVPGGTFSCTLFRDIEKVPDSTKCGYGTGEIVDPDGTVLLTEHSMGKKDAAVYPLTGLIGNVARDPKGTDFLKLYDPKDERILSSSHLAARPGFPHKGEAFLNDCDSWDPIYEVKDQYTTSDVQLVTAARSKDVRCLVTGITGDWSTTMSNGTVQPFAEVYIGAGGDTRLRVGGVSTGEGKLGAYASCVALKQ